MLAAYDRVGGNLIATMEVTAGETDRYGILKPGKSSGRLVEALSLVEKPRPEKAPSRLAIIGRYILQPGIFALLESQSPGAGGEIQLTDAMSRMCGQGRFHGYLFEGLRFDCGDRPASCRRPSLRSIRDRPGCAPAHPRRCPQFRRKRQKKRTGEQAHGREHKRAGGPR
jgi:UTP--glucose-1-phosphate uridylyltransferase